MMRIVDTLLAIPFLVLVIVLQATLSDWSGEATKWIVNHFGGQGIHCPPDQRRSLFLPSGCSAGSLFPASCGPR